MNVSEFFSPENTAHLITEQDKRIHLENAMQYTWLERQADITEIEFSLRSQWFRDVFLKSDHAPELLDAFKASPETVIDTLEREYTNSVRRH